MTLTEGARNAGRRRLESRYPVGKKKGKLNNTMDKYLYENELDKRRGEMEQHEKDEVKKREAMSRLIDLANGNSRAIINANLEKAILHFGRHEGDTGSPEVQGML